MKTYGILFIAAALFLQLLPPRSFGSSARVSAAEASPGRADVTPPLDPNRKGDLYYLVEQTSYPRVSTELLTAMLPYYDLAIPQLMVLQNRSNPREQIGPATILIVFGVSDAVGTLSQTLNKLMDAASANESGKKGGAVSAEAFRRKMNANKAAGYARDAINLGLWRFTDGMKLSPKDVVQRLEKGPRIDLLRSPDHGQKIFSAALKGNDPNLRRGAIALIRLESGGNDFGYDPSQTDEENWDALLKITSFLAAKH